MQNQQKIQIQAAIIALKKATGKSQNAIATQVGVSSANITQILKNNWESISPELWQKVAVSLGVQTNGWQTAEIYNYRRVLAVCENAQSLSSAKIVSFDAGAGKTFALQSYAKNTQNVYYIQLERHYTKKVFLQKFGRVLGMQLTGSICEMIDEIIDKLKSAKKPLVIWDEFDKVLEKKGVFDLFKTFYDATLDFCGFVLCGTTALEDQLKKCVKSNKIGYVELFSRCGREYISLKALSVQDVAMICRCNGILDDKIIAEVRVELGQGDLRQLKNIIEKRKYFS